MTAYITRTGAFLPGEPVDNANIGAYVGTLLGENRIRRRVLKANGIEHRYYALDRRQKATHDVYEMAALAIEACLEGGAAEGAISYLSAGSTHTPLNGPGLSSMLHAELQRRGLVNNALEVNSNAGICTSGAQALVNTCRAVGSGAHRHALCVGVEQPSAILKSRAIKPIYDWRRMLRDVRQSQWFMSVFLRSMLSDGAGAVLVQDRPQPDGTSFAVTWTYSRSFAHETPLCMQLDNRNALLSQDIGVLMQHMGPCLRKVVAEAMAVNDDHLADYKVILPHLSSFFFRRHMLDVFRSYREADGRPIEYWTNLATKGNTGAASIFILLDEYARTHHLAEGDRVLLFIPESGRFNFVLISLQVVGAHQAEVAR
ncbi:MAG: 3-oxoacyl-[acyl-carrier-protein] synthase III C-terminal domain-containing protein [Acidobacteriota bacterium]